MNRLDCRKYQQDIEYVSALDLPWEAFREKTFLVSGATGMIGSFLIDVILHKNLNCTIYALTRSIPNAIRRSTPAWNGAVRFIECDVNRTLPPFPGTIDYVIHAASNTHPVAYATDPIGTIATNIIGTQNMLAAAAAHRASKTIFLSSVEIYGQNRGDCERFDESYCGYIDCNTLRAGYPEGKRAGEALCQAFIRQKGLDVVIPRLPRVYGPTMLRSDTKAVSQFLNKGVAGEDIVLKSEGTQLFSYSYVADAVSGILYCLFYGRSGEAYNIADTAGDVTLKKLAHTIADYAHTQVVFSLPEATEKAGYSKATKALLEGEKLRSLGWSMHYDIGRGIARTMDILREFKAESRLE